MMSNVSSSQSPTRDWHTRWHHIVLVLAMVVLLTLLCADTSRGQSGPPDVSDSVLTRGRALFLGSGNCQECHGPEGRGTDLGPDLTDTVWLHGSGSYQMIMRLVTHGVTQRESTSGAPMPMRGWVPLQDDQLTAVATYVWNLSRVAADSERTTVGDGQEH